MGPKAENDARDGFKTFLVEEEGQRLVICWLKSVLEESIKQVNWPSEFVFKLKPFKLLFFMHIQLQIKLFSQLCSFS